MEELLCVKNRLRNNLPGHDRENKSTAAWEEGNGRFPDKKRPG